MNGIIFISTLNDGYWGIYQDEMEATGYGDNLDQGRNDDTGTRSACRWLLLGHAGSDT
jgi:hypothetical protein